MGVDGLWKLLSPTGRKVSKETLENRILAVDISIWMNQAKNGVYARQGLTQEIVCMLSFFNRICSLLRLGIKPVFVFDGKPPEFKQRLVERRKEQHIVCNKSQNKNTNGNGKENHGESLGTHEEARKKLQSEAISGTSGPKTSSERMAIEGAFRNQIGCSQSSQLVSSQATQLSSSQYSGYVEPSLSQSTSSVGRQDDLNYEVDLRKLRTEIQVLLDLFGIPYINSPGEAEAQCGYLDSIGATNGTITEDSDIFLFGGKRVYKDFFDAERQVMQYKSEDVERILCLDREALVAVAMLTGSDYGTGIGQVGAVRAIEILAEFGNHGVKSLLDFKTWWSESADYPQKLPRLQKFLRQLELPANFPDKNVSGAYLNPVVDSTVKFRFGKPNLEALRKYAEKMFGWDSKKIAELLAPTIKKTEADKIQTKLEKFFQVQVSCPAPVQHSKRMEKALKKIVMPAAEAKQEESGTSIPCSQIIPELTTKSGRLNRSQIIENSQPLPVRTVGKAKAVLLNAKVRKTGRRKELKKTCSKEIKEGASQVSGSSDSKSELGPNSNPRQTVQKLIKQQQVIDLVSPPRPKNPSTGSISPVKRSSAGLSLKFDVDKKKDFSRSQLKANFVEVVIIDD